MNVPRQRRFPYRPIVNPANIHPHDRTPADEARFVLFPPLKFGPVRAADGISGATWWAT